MNLAPEPPCPALPQVLIKCITSYLEARPDDVGRAVFDKDDDLAVDFVTAASNLRSVGAHRHWCCGRGEDRAGN